MRKQAMNPRFEGSTCILPHQKKVGGCTRYGSVRLDLSMFSMAPDSLLMLAISDASYPLSSTNSFKFRRVLQALCSKPNVVEILNSPPRELSSLDIIHLFNFIEDEIEANWGKNSQRGASGQARQMLLAVSDLLCDGATIRDCGFKTRFKPSGCKPPQTSSASRPLYKQNRGTTANPGQNPSQLFLNLNFHTFEERNKQAFIASKNRNQEIAALCLESFSQHKATSELISQIKARGPLNKKFKRTWIGSNTRLDRVTFTKLDEDEQLQYLLNRIEEEQWYISLRTNSIPYPLEKIDKLAINPRIDSKGSRKELLFCDYYLPTYVVAACFVAIQNETALNSEVIETLTAGDIQKTAKGYKITGVKGKTNKIISKEITREISSDEDINISGEAGIQAIQLLLANTYNIKKNLGIEFIPLISTLHKVFPQKDLIQFIQKGAYILIDCFCNFHDLENFDTRYLRHLTLQTHSLSPGGNIYSTQALANHSSILTTEDYIFTTVLSSLYTANIRRFMDMMAASILWRTNRNDVLENAGLDKRGFDLEILFPLKWTEADRSSLIDQWIDSSFKEKISLGLEELHQNKIQYEYYIQNIQRLAEQNYAQFVHMHLPRILTCIALHKIILSSPFAHFYRNISEVGHDSKNTEMPLQNPEDK